VLVSSRETVWGVLTGQTCRCTSDHVGDEVREIETWILRLLSAPVSIPGKTKILVSSIDDFPTQMKYSSIELQIETLGNEPPMLFALPDHTRFSLVDFPLHLPLELLGVDLCIRVLTLIMLENKVTMTIDSFIFIV
jgi:hypothetical protein